MSRSEVDNGQALAMRSVRRSFSAAGRTYDAAAVLQAEVRSRLLDRLDFVKLEPRVVVDLGAGTGHASRALKKRYPSAQVLAIDSAPGMLAEARRQSGWFARFGRVCADARRLPLPPQSVELAFSNLMLQWCDPPDAVLAEVRRVLRPGGLFTFTSFGPDTLGELRAAWSRVDDRPHVHRFIDMHDLGDALVRAGFAEPVLDVERFTLTYADAGRLMRELKAIGAHNATPDRHRGLTGKSALRTMLAAYEEFRTDGLLPATYEVVYGHAWAGTQTPTSRRASGEFAISVDAIRRR